jgi:hypothetical protein
VPPPEPPEVKSVRGEPPVPTWVAIESASWVPEATVMEKVAVVVVTELLSVTVIEIPENVSEAVGVPLITLPLSISPVGSGPVARVYV